MGIGFCVLQGGLINFEKRRKVHFTIYSPQNDRDSPLTCTKTYLLNNILFIPSVPPDPPSLPLSLSIAVSLQEFEVIAQIKLLQLASNNYSFTPDGHFRDWFSSVERLSEAER